MKPLVLDNPRAACVRTNNIPIQSINFPSQIITSGSNLQDDLVRGGLAIEQNHYSCS